MSVFSIWAWVLFWGVVGYMLCRKRIAPLFAIVPIALVVPGEAWFELFSSDFGPTAFEREGWLYVLQLCLATLVAVVLPTMSALRLRARRNRRAVRLVLVEQTSRRR